MPLQTADVEHILYNGGDLKFAKGGREPSWGGAGQGDGKSRVWMGFYMATTQVNRLASTITLTATGDDDPHADAVHAAYEDGWAKIGSITAPGYVYTDSMSGCVFYLYRGALGEVHGVHASRASRKLIDPSQYFTQRGCSLLYKWDSLGKLVGALQGCFGAVLCCVGDTGVEAFAVALSGTKVKRLLDHTTIDNWRRALPPVL